MNIKRNKIALAAKKQSGILFLTIMALCLTGMPVLAESLFRTGISQGVSNVEPRSLFNTIKAKAIGDVITILIEENSSVDSEVKLAVQNKSSSTDAFTPILNSLFKTDKFTNLNGYGGSTTTGNNASITRTTKTSDTITAQVVQILPNGNLVVQGKKTEINSKEKEEIVVSGVVDPRFITNSGQVSSKYVANLQFAIVGNGTASGSQDESLMNKFMKVLF